MRSGVCQGHGRRLCDQEVAYWRISEDLLHKDRKGNFHTYFYFLKTFFKKIPVSTDIGNGVGLTPSGYCGTTVVMTSVLYNNPFLCGRAGPPDTQ